MVRSNACVEDKDIRLLMRFKLSESNRDRFITHLGKCEKCQKRLAEFNNIDV